MPDRASGRIDNGVSGWALEDADTALEAVGPECVDGALNVSDADVWAAFDAALDLPEIYTGTDARTRTQIAAHLGISKEQAQKFAEAAVEAGTLRRVHVRAGNGHLVDGYVPVREDDNL